MGKKYTLDVDFSYSFYIVGIVSNENDYRLTWLLNEHLGLMLQRTNNYLVKIRGSEVEFPMFSFMDEEKYLKYYLIKNKISEHILIKELKHIDYIIEVIGEISEMEADALLHNLRSVPNISTAINIDPEGLKAKDLLLLH